MTLLRDRIFNLHDLMLLVTATLALLVALPMLFRRGRRNTDVLLAGFVLTQGFIALYYLVLYADPFRPALLSLLQPFQVMPLIVLYTLQGFLLYWYSGVMGGNRICVSRNELWLLAYLWIVPILALAFLWKYGPRFTGFDGVVLAIPALAASIVYGVLAWRALARHDAQIREQFSNIDDKNLIWLSYSAVGFVGIWLVRLAGMLAGVSMHDNGHYWANTISMWSNPPAMILIAWIVILGLTQERAPAARSDDAQDEGDVSKPVNEEAARRLEELMTRVKVYQDPELNREGLADSLGVSPRTLTTIINGHFGLTFYEFVNQYRVREAMDRLGDTSNAHLTVQRIFEDAGFNSKSTFNTLFKKATGKTPSEYRRQTTLSTQS